MMLVQKIRKVLQKLQKQKSQYLFKLITEKAHRYATRNVDSIPCFKIRHRFFKNSFFPSTVIEWNSLDPTPRNSESVADFKNNILKFIRTSPSNVFNFNNYKGIGLIIRLRVGMSHLRDHKFKHNFQDCLNPIGNCGLDIESASDFLIHCPTFNDERYILLSTLHNINCELLELTKSYLSQILLYGNTLFNKEKNTLILMATTEYVLFTERFEEHFIQQISIGIIKFFQKFS